MINLRIPAREMSATEGMCVELWPRRAQVSAFRNRSGGKDHNSGRSAQVLLCLPRGCVCVCLCTWACTRLVAILACKTQSRQIKTDEEQRYRNNGFIFLWKSCKSCSRTQCNWKHTRQRRRTGFLGQTWQNAGKQKSNWQLRWPQRR